MRKRHEMKSLDCVDGQYIFHNDTICPWRWSFVFTFLPGLTDMDWKLDKGKCLFFRIATNLLLLVKDELNTLPQSCFNLMVSSRQVCFLQRGNMNTCLFNETGFFLFIGFYITCSHITRISSVTTRWDAGVGNLSIYFQNSSCIF